jgi:quercetin dioxygenase-like cupin family protein
MESIPMAVKGRIIPNPATGEYIEFVETAEETGGHHTTIKVLQKAGGFKPVLHVHTTTDESFTVIEGELTYELEGKKGIVQRGESLVLPKGKVHTHYNDSPNDLLMLQTFTPSLDIEVFLENLFGLTAEGKVRNGQPALLQVLVWLRSFSSKTYLAALPIDVQDALAALLAPVGRVFGYKAAYARFSGFDR